VSANGMGMRYEDKEEEERNPFSSSFHFWKEEEEEERVTDCTRNESEWR
jgi:hypothetical protein